MKNSRARRWGLLGVLLVLLAALASTAAAQPPDTSEVWVADQGTNKIHILSELGKSRATLDLNGLVSKPHMVFFARDHRYALTANIGSGDVAVIRASDRRVLDVIETDPGAHAAVPSPDGEQVAVAHTTGQSLVELTWDEERETYAIGRRLDLANAPELADKTLFPNGSAVCPAYTADGEAIYVTLGGGGLLVVDAGTFRIIRAYGKDRVAPNGCGLAPSKDGSRMYANSGTLTGGSLYVFDTSTHELLRTAGAGGLDPHGMAVLPDGSLLALNRLSDTATIHDPTSLEVTRTVPVGDAPDLPALSVNDRFAYLTLRGEEPATGTHDLAGTTPGIQIIEVDAMRPIKTVRLDPSPNSDPHGIAVRPVPVNR
jgi:DNA-binding beta-propeller fold protein YncE